MGIMTLIFIRRKPCARRGGDLPGSQADQRHHASHKLSACPAGLGHCTQVKRKRPEEFTVYPGVGSGGVQESLK